MSLPIKSHQENPPLTSNQLGVPPTEAKTKEKSLSIEVGQLSASFEVQDLSTPRTYSTELPAKSSSFFASLTNFLHRHFGYLTEAQKQEVKSTKDLMKLLNDALSGIEGSDKQIQRNEKKIRGKDASQDTLKVTSDNLVKSTVILHNANVFLKQLQKHKQAAQQLSSEYARFSSLPQEIESLENQVAHLRAKVKVIQEIRKFEEALIDYDEGKSWDQFKTVQTQAELLSKQLTATISNDPTLKDSKSIQKLLQQSSEKPLQKAQSLLKRAHPSLTVHLDRLSDNVTRIQERRLDILEKKAEVVKKLTDKYREHAYKISDLEERLYGKTLKNRIAQITDKLFSSTEKKEKELETAEMNSKLAFDEIQREGMFNPEEMEWLKAVAKDNSKKQPLARNVVLMQKLMSHISTREEISDKMTDLFLHLEKYRANADIDKKENSPSRSSRSKLNLRKSSSDQLAQRMMKTLHGEINAELSDIALQVKSTHENFTAFRPLPTNFETLSPLEQFQAYSLAAFPKLSQRTQNIIEIIKSQGLVDDANAMIKKTWNQGFAETAPREEPETPKPVDAARQKLGVQSTETPKGETTPTPLELTTPIPPQPSSPPPPPPAPPPPSTPPPPPPPQPSKFSGKSNAPAVNSQGDGSTKMNLLDQLKEKPNLKKLDEEKLKKTKEDEKEESSLEAMVRATMNKRSNSLNPKDDDDDNNDDWDA